MKFEEMSNETKASMTESQIREQIKIEMMEGDITEVEQPMEFDLEKPPMKTETYYVIGGIYFKTLKQAEQFKALDPKKDNYDWRVGSEVRYVDPIDGEIRIEKPNIKEEIQEKGQELIEYYKQYHEYDRRKRKYDNYISTRNAIADKIWSVYVKAKEIVDEKQKIKDEYQEYTKLTNGDMELAYTFLVKHYGEEKVKSVVTDATTEKE
jgi:pyruvate/2-oxoacid:ferredoxin oxidoreductase beta subunit